MKKTERITFRTLVCLVSILVHVLVLSAITMPQVAAQEREPSYLELTNFSEFQPEPEIELPELDRNQPETLEPEPAPEPVRTPEAIVLLPVPEPEPEKEKEKAKDKPNRLTLPSRQIVDLGPPEPNDEAPEKDTRFFSERNMKTDHETVKPSEARTGSPGDDPGRKPAEIENPTTRPEQSRQRAKSGPEPTPRNAARRGSKPKPKSTPPPKDLAPLHPGNDGITVTKKPDPKDELGLQKPPPPPGGNSGGSDLMVSMADLQKNYDSDNGSVDFLPEIQRGEITSLNSKAYTYAAFFNRIKKIVKFYWDPRPALEMIKWTGTPLYSELRVVIDAEGNLVEAEVIKSCGYPLVDAAAISAFRRAAPFYNVPPALLNENGLLVDKWSFFIH